jgi:hypothetical protein
MTAFSIVVPSLDENKPVRQNTAIRQTAEAAMRLVNGATLDLGTASGTITPEQAQGAAQAATNNGAFTLSPPTSDGLLNLMVTNGATAGAITFTGWTRHIPGDALTTTNGQSFLIIIRKIAGVSSYQIVAMQ